MKRSILLVLSLLFGFTIVEGKHLPRSSLKLSKKFYYGDCSENYINRWEFQNSCYHVYDPRVLKKNFPTNPNGGVTFNPAQVKPGDVIFVRDPLSFFTKMHPNITSPYIIVVHGQSIDGCSEKILPYLDNKKIIAYFTIHACPESHPKIIPLPAGVIQKEELHEKKGEINKLFAQLRERSEKKHLLYCNFLNRTNAKRQEIRKLFEDKKFCYNAHRTTFSKYIKQVAKSKFILSPPGAGPDTNRTWESLLVGSIPIVESSQLNPLYVDLPVLVVNDWSQITEKFLKSKYEEISSDMYDIRKLYMEYWLDWIENVRKDFLNDYQSKLNLQTSISMVSSKDTKEKRKLAVAPESTEVAMPSDVKLFDANDLAISILHTEPINTELFKDVWLSLINITKRPLPLSKEEDPEEMEPIEPELETPVELELETDVLRFIQEQQSYEDMESVQLLNEEDMQIIEPESKSMVDSFISHDEPNLEMHELQVMNPEETSLKEAPVSSVMVQEHMIPPVISEPITKKQMCCDGEVAPIKEVETPLTEASVRSVQEHMIPLRLAVAQKISTGMSKAKSVTGSIILSQRSSVRQPVTPVSKQVFRKGSAITRKSFKKLASVSVHKKKKLFRKKVALIIAAKVMQQRNRKNALNIANKKGNKKGSRL